MTTAQFHPKRDSGTASPDLHLIHGRKKPALLVVGGLALACFPALACSWAGAGGALTALQTNNAYWNCPTRTPRPTVTPVPTTCVEVTATPNPDGTPGPIVLQCEDPQSTATPWPTV